MLVVIFSLVYLLVRRLVELLVLRGRSDASKDVEILVLRHQFSVLRLSHAKTCNTGDDLVFHATI